ncbi:MAG: hypothetical protein Q7T85_03140 [Nitrosomonas sp.]|nr:hypothetical protein [Nitrosomonas sp.]
MPCAIGGAGLPLLLVLDDQAANFPVTRYHSLVNALAYLAARLLNDLGNLTGQGFQGVMLRRGMRFISTPIRR